METRIWHPLCLDGDLGDAPLPITLLSEDLVLWRDAGGSPVLMKNQCPHRGARLSLGRVQGDRLECPYHGWQFDRTGTCVAVPAVPDFRPPASHRACTYRVASAHGLLWGLLGEGPQLPAPLVGLAARQLVHGPWNVAVSAPRVVENFLDTAHFAHVHNGWLGEAGQTQVPDYAITHTADGRPVVEQYRAWQPRATASAAAGGWVTYRYEVLGPYSALLTKQPEDGSAGDSFTLWACPLDDEHCRVWMGQYTADTRSSDAQLRDFQQTIFGQDQPILESQRPKRLPLSGGEVHSAADRLSTAYRRYLQKLGIRCGVC